MMRVLINFLKGIVAGIGGIVPGLSGSVLMVLLGVYEPTIHALGTLMTNFKKNIRFLLPLLLGMGCGVLLFTSCSLQQIGLMYTTAGKSGFITSLYIILVPIFGLFMKKKVISLIWVSVMLAICGLYLLCGGGVTMGRGELYTLACSVAFAFHILFIDRISAKVDGVSLKVALENLHVMLSDLKKATGRNDIMIATGHKSDVMDEYSTGKLR